MDSNLLNLTTWVRIAVRQRIKGVVSAEESQRIVELTRPRLHDSGVTLRSRTAVDKGLRVSQIAWLRHMSCA
jgi:hypothetical protein